MRTSIVPKIAVALCFLLPCAARAQDDPEAVYAKVHRAMLEENLDDMIKYGTPGGASDLAKQPAPVRKEALEMLKKVMPQHYKITSKQLSPDGNSLTMRGTGTGAIGFGGGSGAQDGVIRMVKQGGEWKVDDVQWHGRKAEAAKAAATASPAPEPERKMGAVKEPCVYKPVMTDEEIARCR